ncbi:unnamed protein product [Prorocentrum cordatum]|uniref:PDZ domain-containing protein n=1 Tax=Prorocentrum cordatum TaxID=2364126 RepID=A0ABN9WEZ3_9DINO|nr:unnamed protein product [Polarella glacialis]CAK0884952.1 unnamed protein product [Polarella glacialis]
MGGLCSQPETAEAVEVQDVQETSAREPAAATAHEITVTLTKTGDAKLGLDISHFHYGEEKNKVLKVKLVKDGIVKDWNDKNPGSTIETNDLITSINGVSSNSEDMLKEVKANELVIVVKKGGALVVK